MPSLKDELLNEISRVKEKLYPLLERADHLNESAKPAKFDLQQAWRALESAAETIKARANDDIPAIQQRFR